MSIAIVAIAGATALANPVAVYDPGLGTLPTSQGWLYPGSLNPPMTVAGGILSYGPTTTSGTAYWEVEPTPGTVDFTQETWSIEAEIRLTGAQFGNFSGFRRGGFSLHLVDDAGRWIIAEFGDSKISLRNDNTGLSDPVATMDLTGAFHGMMLTAGPDGARLLVDGVQALTLGLGSGSGAPAQAFWGESTILARADLTEIKGVTVIPAPGLGAGAMAAVMLLARRRR